MKGVICFVSITVMFLVTKQHKVHFDILCVFLKDLDDNLGGCSTVGKCQSLLSVSVFVVSVNGKF